MSTPSAPTDATAPAIPAAARAMVLSALCFSLMGLMVKAAGARLPWQEMVVARSLVSFVMSYAVLRAQSVPLLGKRRGLLLLRGVFGFCGLCCVFYAVTHMPLAEATVLQYMHPAFTALLAALVLGERIDRHVVAAIVLSMAGLVVVAQPALLFGAGGPSYDPLAVAAGVMGAVFSACAYVTVRTLGASEHPHVIVFYFPMVALPASLAGSWSSLVWPQGWEWLLLLGLGVATQLGQITLTRGLSGDRAGRATSYSYTQVLFAVLWGALFFSESPPLTTWLGAGLILSGALSNLRSSRRGEERAGAAQSTTR